MPYSPINFIDKFNRFQEHWSPKIIAQMNDIQFKLVRLQGEFVWHSHAETEEVFIVLDGEMQIEFRDGTVPLSASEMLVIPKGVAHRPATEAECKVPLAEPACTVNTGDAGGDLTAPNHVWI